jgi:hypothetical protein
MTLRRGTQTEVGSPSSCQTLPPRSPCLPARSSSLESDRPSGAPRNRFFFGSQQHAGSYVFRWLGLLISDATLSVASSAPKNSGFELERRQANTGATDGQQAKGPKWNGQG